MYGNFLNVCGSSISRKKAIVTCRRDGAPCACVPARGSPQLVDTLFLTTSLLANMCHQNTAPSLDQAERHSRLRVTHD